MKELLKMYHIFFPNRRWLWVLYVLYPAIIIFLACIWNRFSSTPEFGIGMGTMCAVSLLDIGEYLLDSLSFYGIAARENASMEFVRASKKGMRAVKTALVMDALRRILTTAFVLAVAGNYARNCFGTGYELFYVQIWLVLLLLVEGGLWIVRKYKNAVATLLVLYFSSAFACGAVPGILAFANMTAVIVLAIVLMVIMVGTRLYLIKKGKENYYDCGFEKVHHAV